MPKRLRRTEFGNPILRSTYGDLAIGDILSAETQQLITDMCYTLEHRQYGIGLAAPQVGKALRISVIGIKPTPSRPDLKPERLLIINPHIVRTYGRRQPAWEGCISGGELYALVPRYERVRLSWQDERARTHERDFDGLIAQVIQHEVDHLDGILFVDRVKDTSSYMTTREYRKMRKTQAEQDDRR